MRNVFLVFLFVSGIYSASYAQDRQQILSVLKAQSDAWNTGDLVGYMQGYEQSDSLLFVGKSGPTYGWEQTLANYQKNYPDKQAMGLLTFDVKKIQLITGDMAFVLGAWHLKRQKDEPKGYFTLIFKKFKTGWKIISDHSS